MKLKEANGQKYGWFYYRFAGGESLLLNCYDRMLHILESLVRQAERKQKEKRAYCFTGLTIRCFVTRYCTWAWNSLIAWMVPIIGDFVTIADKNTLTNPQFTSGQWGCHWAYTASVVENSVFGSIKGCLGASSCHWRSTLEINPTNQFLDPSNT